MSKIVTFQPMEKMLKGFNTVADAVVGTLGPKGRNVFVDDPMAPKITNDGATIAANIQLEDKVENMGAHIVRNTSSQTNDDAGDGTTTTAVLLQSIVHEALKRPENPMVIKDSLKEASKKVLSVLKTKAITIDKKDLERVALISAEDKNLARLITEIVNKVGENAVINVEDSRGFDTGYEIVEGYEAHVGFMSPHFINEPRKARAIMNEVPVIVAEDKISSVADITALFEQFKKRGITSAVIVCDDIETSILGILVASKLQGTFNAIVVKAVGPLLMDIEASVGATRVSKATGVSFQMLGEDQYWGFAKRVICDANKTIFIANSDKSKEYATHLEKSAKSEPNMYVQKKLYERVSKLRGGVATLKIGASSDFEREYLKFKAEDAIKAVKAALEEGVVEGGGMTLWRIAQGINPKTIGDEILKRALTQPLRKIIENAGKDYAEVVFSIPEGKGYDAKKDTYVDMVEAGIIDPAKVERCALENAVSAAGVFITTFATISDYQETKTK